MIPDGAQQFMGAMGKDLTVTLTKEGVYGYQCTPHGSLGMVGLIVVGAPINEAAARSVPVPALERRTFDKLFAALDRSHNEHAAR
jgi:pseudoazurin